MGWRNYFVVPKLKAMFDISRDSAEDDAELLKKELEKLDERESVDVDGWTPESLKHQGIIELAEVIHFYDRLSPWLYGWKREELMLIFILKAYDKDAFVLCGLDEKAEELKKEGYIVMEYESE